MCHSALLPVSGNGAIPLNCNDGFNEAYYGRPEKLLDTRARLACSAWSLIDHPLQNPLRHT
jgi:hypothetical protein